MCHAALAEASRNLRLILTLTRAPQSFRSVPSTLSRTSSDTHSSGESVRGLGSDFGNFLYWFGERLLDGWGEVIIQVRLLSIHRAIQHKGIVEHADIAQVTFIRRACEYLLDLCRYVNPSTWKPQYDLSHKYSYQHWISTAHQAKGVGGYISTTKTSGRMVLYPPG